MKRRGLRECVRRECATADCELLGEHAGNARFDEQRRLWLVPVEAAGRTAVIDDLLPARARIRLALSVQLPDASRERPPSDRRSPPLRG